MATKETAKKYFEGIGRRKTAVARVRIAPGAESKITVNEKTVERYFPLKRLADQVTAPLKALKFEEKMMISAKVSGGGVAAQAEAVRHGLSRALVKLNASFKPRLRLEGFMTRDPRMVERKKYGLKKARRAPQWQKR